MSDSTLDLDEVRRAVVSVLSEPATREAIWLASGVHLGHMVIPSVPLPGAREAAASVLADVEFQRSLEEATRRGWLEEFP